MSTLKPPVGDSEFAAAARLLARRLELLAQPAPDGPVWEGDDLDPGAGADSSGGGVLWHGRLDEGLLTGRAGIALALSACSRLPGGSPSWGSLAVRAASAAVRVADEGAVGFGWDSGGLGVAQAAAVIAGHQGEETLAVAARRLTANTLRDILGRPDRLPPWPDLLGGIGGVLCGVRCAPLSPADEPLRNAATGLLVTRLAELAGDDDPGWTMASSGLRVVGLAHGQSGIALALLLAARGLRAGAPGSPVDTGLGERARALAGEALAWEEGWYDPERGGWPDLRTAERVPGLAWCHGAPGVGVVAALVAAGDGVQSGGRAHTAFLRARAASAPHRPVGDGVFDGTVCHGLAGVVELHLTAAAAWPASATEHLQAARQLAAHLTRAGRPGRPPWGCGLPGGGRTPNALVGIAGVALTLARCHDPNVAPGVADPTLGRLTGW